MLGSMTKPSVVVAIEPRTSSGTNEQLRRGQALFARNCASCHGPTGAGDGSAGRDLDPRPSDLRGPGIAGKSEEQIFRKITRGRQPMPAFGKLLDESDRRTLAGYVKHLGAPVEGRPAR